MEAAPTPSPHYSLGIDIGGTFTDVVLYNDAAGVTHAHKELTTPEDPASGVITALRRLFAREGLAFAQVTRVVHATTLFTNALIERKGAPTGLITTAGFRDILEIGRERKYELYDIFIQMPKPLVRRSLRLEVAERLAPDGTIEIPLDTQALADRAEQLVGSGVTSIAIVFLHAYANPVHEHMARDLVQRLFPAIHVSISSDVAPLIREYERISTTVADATIKPLADGYLARLEAALNELGLGAELFLMLSNGGLTTRREARRRPIAMLESGPAAGALAAAWFGARSLVANLLAFDMGGTTAKLSVVDNGRPLIATSFEAARERRFAAGSGLPITISTVELIEIGAGGGSIAAIDELGLLAVGPRSAGAVPGPACYRLGGDQPTVTDANLLLGYLDTHGFAGGTMTISRNAAEAALRPLAETAGLDLIQLAWGIHDVVNESMAAAARVHLAEHGHDPRGYALLATGGGGPLHGCEVARKLGISRVICPPSAGVASAIGLLVAPARIDRVATIACPLDGMDWPRLERAYSDLATDARQVIGETGLDPAGFVVTRLADMRYIGQGFELVVALPDSPYHPDARAAIQARFEARYRDVFSRIPPQSAIEVINIRVSAEAPVGAGGLRAVPPAELAPAWLAKGTRPAFFGGGGAFVMTPVYERCKLGAGSHITGPALIEEPDSTLLLPPDGQAIMEANGNLVVTLQGVSAIAAGQDSDAGHSP